MLKYNIYKIRRSTNLTTENIRLSVFLNPPCPFSSVLRLELIFPSQLDIYQCVLGICYISVSSHIKKILVVPVSPGVESACIVLRASSISALVIGSLVSLFSLSVGLNTGCSIYISARSILAASLVGFNIKVERCSLNFSRISS